MADAMVTARMSQSKKEAGAAVLAQLGKTASEAINGMYDYLIRTGKLPYEDPRAAALAPSRERLAAAASFVDGIRRVPRDDFDSLSDDELKQRRLIAKGRATEGDFA